MTMRYSWLPTGCNWLYVMALDYLMKGEEFPECHFNNEPKHGGKMVVVAVSASLDQVPSMTAAEAARTLGISAARVAQLCKAGYLESWKVGGTRMVSRDSVEARAEEVTKAGRPKKGCVVA